MKTPNTSKESAPNTLNALSNFRRHLRTAALLLFWPGLTAALHATPVTIPDSSFENTFVAPGGTYVESVGAGRPAGMTAGGAASDLMRSKHQIPELYNDGMHHLWQDFSAVNDNAAPLLLQGLCNLTKQLKIEPSTVDHYVVSIPTSRRFA